jgi:GTP cyclohydrolase I
LTLLEDQPTTLTEPWEEAVRHGIRLFLEQTALAHHVISEEHVRDTPDRVARAFGEYFSGCSVDPAACLDTDFMEGGCDEMVIKDVPFISWCAHHLAPLCGRAHFAYIPDKKIIGLSKISRFINVLAKRPQVQEKFSSDIVDVFQNTFKPLGCAVNVRAFHFCTIARGVNEHPSPMETTALRGVFKKDASTRAEFLQSINRSEPIFP